MAWLRAQQRIAFARLPPFERAVVCVKFFEGFHGKGCYPYVGYGHQLQKGEHFSSNMPEWQADSLLRADLMAQFDHFKCYGKMLYSFLFWLIMSGLGAFLAMASSQRVGYCGRLKQEIETFIESMFRSADLKEKF